MRPLSTAHSTRCENRSSLDIISRRPCSMLLYLWLFTTSTVLNDRNGRGAAPDGFVTDRGAQERERAPSTDR
jgi:hypothetical protein